MLSDHPVFPILLSTDLDATRTFYRTSLASRSSARTTAIGSSSGAAAGRSWSSR